MRALTWRQLIANSKYWRAISISPGNIWKVLFFTFKCLSIWLKNLKWSSTRSRGMSSLLPQETKCPRSLLSNKMPRKVKAALWKHLPSCQKWSPRLPKRAVPKRKAHQNCQGILTWNSTIEMMVRLNFYDILIFYTMKNGGFEITTPLKDDEKFLEGINLITGDLIDYSCRVLVSHLLHRPKHKSMHSASTNNYPKLKSLSRLSLKEKRYRSGPSSKISPSTLKAQTMLRPSSPSLRYLFNHADQFQRVWGVYGHLRRRTCQLSEEMYRNNTFHKQRMLWHSV